jgi:hypothetical protein
VSFEWFDRLKRLVVSSLISVAEELVDVGGTLFLDVRHRPPGRLPESTDPSRMEIEAFEAELRSAEL